MGTSVKWYNQIRWRLFFSHLVIIVIAVAVFLTIANLMAGATLIETNPLLTEPYVLTVGSIPSLTSTPVVQTAAYLAMPARADGSPCTIPHSEAEKLSQRYETVVHEALLAGAFAALSAAILVNLFVTRRIVEPLQEISKASRRLSLGFYRERIAVRSNDELSELCRSINQLAEALEKTEARRLALLADVTHELRTPLATIEGYMEGMVDGIIKPDTQTLALLMRETVRLQRLIEDLELLSRVEAGQIPVHPRPIDLAQLLRDLVLRFRTSFQQKGVILELVLLEQLPLVHADPDRVEQIVINLLDNALRYTPSSGKVLVQAWSKEGYAIVSVRDTGIGVAPEHLRHLFERFYRVDKSRSRSSGGSGIGLTIASHLVYAQGGEIRAQSAGVGHGADFRFTLPLARTPATSPTSKVAAKGTSGAIRDRTQERSEEWSTSSERSGGPGRPSEVSCSVKSSTP